jgi:hypothetical protein
MCDPGAHNETLNTLTYCHELPMKYVWLAVRNLDAFREERKFEDVTANFLRQ